MTSPPPVDSTSTLGRLHIYLGTAPGVGKSFAMLHEGRRLAAAGADVVVAYLEAHDRDATARLVEGLEVVAPKVVSYRGSTFSEMDVDAVLARAAEVVIVDELAHTNVPGQRHAKRWQDVEELLASGMDVISNVNVQHLDSLQDDIERLTGVVQRETLPDGIIASADHVELVELAPDALRERVRQLAGDGVGGDVALDRWFTTENLRGLHNLAVEWMGRHLRSTGRAASSVRGERGSIVVSLDAGSTGDRLVRRAAEIANRTGAGLIGVHVCVPSGLAAPTRGLESRRRILTELGGRYAEVGALDRGDAVIDFARSHGATELVIGAPTRSRWQRLIHGSPIDRLVVEASDAMELHVVAVDGETLPGLRPVTRSDPVRFSPRRRVLAWALAIIGPCVVAGGLLPWRASLGLAGALLAMLLVVAVGAAIGGLGPSLVAAGIAFALADFFFTIPYHSFRVDHLVDLVGLLVFAGVAIIVSVLVNRLARASLRDAQGLAEAGGVARLTAATLPQVVVEHPELLDEVRTVFGLDAAALMERGETGWTMVYAVGDPIPESPDDGSAAFMAGPNTVLILTGGGLPEGGSTLLHELVEEMGRRNARAQLSRLTG